MTRTRRSCAPVSTSTSRTTPTHRALRLARVAAALLALSSGCRHAAPTAPPSPPPLATGAYPEYGHAPNLTWFAGRIAKPLDGCVYVVFGSARRAPWGGRVALTAAPEMLARVPAGDMVVAFGRFSATPRGACGSATLAASQVLEH